MESVWRMALRSVMMTALVVAAIYFAWVLVATKRIPTSPYVYGAIFLLLPAVADVVLDRGTARTDRMKRGAVAEEKIESVLSRLSDEFCVLHDVDFGRGNVDHIVVGPSGIYTIETKSHRGNVTFVDGRLLLNGRPPKEKDFLKQSYAEAMVVKEYLKTAFERDYHVQPVLVFTRAFVNVKGKADGVQVVPAKWLVKSLTRGDRGPADPVERTLIGDALKREVA